MNDNAKKSIKTNVTLKKNENMLKFSTFECVKQCVAKKNADEKFNVFAII